MERIGIEDAHSNLTDIVHRVESGKEIMLTRNRKNIAHITPPEQNSANKKNQFFQHAERIESKTLHSCQF